MKERTEGRVKIAVYSKGELGAEMGVIQQIQFGGIDFAPVSYTHLPLNAACGIHSAQIRQQAKMQYLPCEKAQRRYCLSLLHIFFTDLPVNFLVASTIDSLLVY